MPSGHPLAARQTVQLTDLAPYDVIGAKRGSALEQLLLEGAAASGVVLRIRLRVAGFDTLYRMVEVGLGIGFGPSTSAKRYGRHMQVIGRPLAESWAQRHLTICLPMGEIPPHVALLVEHLRRHKSAFAKNESLL
jgi:DNA-binding transcriptional LysR family regulator